MLAIAGLVGHGLVAPLPLRTAKASGYQGDWMANVISLEPLLDREHERILM